MALSDSPYHGLDFCDRPQQRAVGVVWTAAAALLLVERPVVGDDRAEHRVAAGEVVEAGHAAALRSSK